jgi:site-specific DNA-cytosine methylase
VKVIELFSGTGRLSEAFRAQGHETLTIDINPDNKPVLVLDIGSMSILDLPPEWRHPDVVWASPPCNRFSVIRLSSNWRNGHPKNKETADAIVLVWNTVQLIKTLNPKYFFMENPRGMMRKLHFLRNFGYRRTITYCQYGEKRQKTTDIWTNNLNWRPKRRCSAGMRCHDRAPRGSSRSGTCALPDAKTRGALPLILCAEIAQACCPPQSDELCIKK